MRTFRKSWTVYPWPIIWVGIWTYLSYVSVTNFDELLAMISQYKFIEDMGIGFETGVAISAGAFLFLLLTILRVFWLLTYRIDIDEAGLRARHGILPWNKWQRSWENHQIFNCLYQGRGFFNWIFGRGSLILQGSEGTTHEFVFTNIGKVKKACALVNEIRTGGK